MNSLTERLSYPLSLALIFSIAFENIIDVPGIGTLSRTVGLLLATGWLFGVVISGRWRQPHLFHLFAALFAVWNAATMLWTMDSALTWAHLKTYAQLALLSFILWDIYRSEAAVRAALQAYVLGAYVAIGSTLFNYISGVNSDYQRFTGAGFNADDLGLFLALAMPAAWYLTLAANRGGAILRLLNLAYLPAAIFAISLSGTRTALLATLPALAYVAASSGRIGVGRGLLLVAAALGGVLALLPFVPEASLERFASIADEFRDGGFNGRTDLWAQGLQVWLDRPLLGMGSNAYRVAINPDNVAHNVFVSVLVETGAIGFLLFASTLTLTATLILSQPRAQRWMWTSVLAVWLCGAMALTIEHRKQTWLMLNLAVCSAAVYHGRRRPLQAATPVSVSGALGR